MAKEQKLIAKLKELIKVLEHFIYRHYNLFPEKDADDKATSDKIESLESEIGQLESDLSALEQETKGERLTDEEIKTKAHNKLDWFNEQVSGVFWGTDFEVGYFAGYKDAVVVPQSPEMREELIKFSEYFNNNGGTIILNKDIDNYLNSKSEK